MDFPEPPAVDVDPDFTALRQLLRLLPDMEHSVLPGRWWERYSETIGHSQSYLGENLYAHTALHRRTDTTIAQVTDLAAKCLMFFNVADNTAACVVLNTLGPGFPDPKGAFGKLWAGEVSRLALALYVRYRTL